MSIVYLFVCFLSDFFDAVVENPPPNEGDPRDASSTPVELESSREDSPRIGNGNIHAWKIPWTEKPGGLPSRGSQRVRHD